MSEQAIKNLTGELKELRRGGGVKTIDKMAVGLCELMDCTDASATYKTARLIKLIHHFVPDDESKDLLFLAFRLLEGYTDRGVETRHLKYYKDFISAKRIKSPEEAERIDDLLRKRENKAMRYLAEFALDHGNIPDVVADAPEEFELEKPRMTKIKEIRVTHNLKYDRNPYFTGRDDKLAELQKHFSDGKDGTIRQLIHGLPGMGKTQLALEYAYVSAKEPERKYDVIWWLNAGDQREIEEAISDFVQQKGLTDSNNFSVICKEFRQWFEGSENHSRWLLIYDNVEDFNMVNTYLPKLGCGHIIYTAKFRHELRMDHVIHLEPLLPPASEAFLRERGGIKDETSAKKLANRLGHFPLALEYAAAYISEDREMDVIQYLELLGEYGVELLEEEVDTIDYERTVRETWLMSMRKMPTSAQQLLYLCSYFTPNYIELWLFSVCPESMPPPFGEEFASERERRRIIKKLEKYSLLKFTNHQIYIHSLLQEVIRAEAKKDTIYIRSCLASIRTLIETGELITKIRNDYDRGRVGKCIYYATSVAGYARELLLDEASQLVLADTFVSIAYAVMRFSETSTPASQKFLEVALEIRIRILGEEHILVAEIYHALGGLFALLCKIDHAMMYYSRTLELYKKLLEPEHISLARLHMDIAILHMRGENFPSAIVWLKRALTPDKEALAHNNVQKCKDFKDLFLPLGDNSNMEELDKLLLQYQATEAVGMAYYYIGNCLMVMDKCGEALEWLQKALPIQEALNHPERETFQVLEELKRNISQCKERLVQAQ